MSKNYFEHLKAVIIRKGKAGYGHLYAKDFGKTDLRSTGKQSKVEYSSKTKLSMDLILTL